MTAGRPNILFFEDIDKDQVLVVGGKCASLGEMTRAGIPVPPGFAVTTHAYRNFLTYNQLDKKICEVLASIKENDVEQIERGAANIKTMIESSPVPEQIAEEIEDSYRTLWKNAASPLMPVAVRSSATAEDMADASFAGQQDTFLFVRKGEEVIDKVIKCWASLFSVTALTYRQGLKICDDGIAMSVAVQKMINADTAGVMFTINPLTGDRSTIVINSNFGVGESVVSGEVTPDEFFINKVTLEVTRRVIAPKEFCCVPGKSQRGLLKKESPPERRDIQSIVDEDLIALAGIGKKVEKHYGRPMDIEWALEKRGSDSSFIYILQARPETVWSARKTNESAGKKLDVMDMIVEKLRKGQKLDI